MKLTRYTTNAVHRYFAHVLREGYGRVLADEISLAVPRSPRLLLRPCRRPSVPTAVPEVSRVVLVARGGRRFLMSQASYLLKRRHGTAPVLTKGVAGADPPG